VNDERSDRHRKLADKVRLITGNADPEREAIQGEAITGVRTKLPRMRGAVASGLGLLSRERAKIPLQSGFAELDDNVIELGDKEVTMLAADAGVGKSTIAAQFALHAGRCGYGVVYFNLEMPEEKFGLRTVANFVGVKSKRAMTGRVTDHERALLMGGGETLAIPADHIVVGNMREHRTPGAMRELCAKAKAELEAEGFPLKLIVIDHVLQILVNVKNDKDAEGKARADIIKELAESFNAHLVALVHITRDASKHGKMPTKNDLASSAWFDRHADNILIFHQPRNKDGTFIPGTPAKLACQKSRYAEPFAIELEYQAGFFYPWRLDPEV
jgi:replicative DNA helicase